MRIGNRSGALNGTVWGTSRASGGGNNLGQGTADAWGTTPEVRCGTTSTVQPEGDIDICDGHMVEAVNDNHDVTGLAMYPKQPFDIARRTGTVVFDVSDDSDGTHRAWPEFWYTDKPIPVPLIHDTSWISVPKDGLGIQLAGSCVPNQGCGACPGVAPYYRVGFSSAFVIRDYVLDTFGAAYADSRRTLFDCVAEPTSPGELNHFEIPISQNQIDVYGTDAGTTTPLKHLVNIANTNLTLTRGLIWIVDDHYNGNKTAGPPPDITNAHDPRAAALGQALFFDPGFSGPLLEDANDGGPGTLGTKGQTGKVACVSCHDPAHGFVDDRSPDEPISLGAGWGRRRARSLLDVGQAKLVGWDGRHDTLYNSTIGALESPVDVNTSRLYVAEQIILRYGAEYQAIFGTFPGELANLPPLTAAASGSQSSVTFTPEPTCGTLPRGMPGDGAEYDSLSYERQNAVTVVAVNAGKAIAAYERLLTCGPSRFDAWVHGQEDALNASEQRGARGFVQSCVVCHSGPYLSDNAPHNVGLRPTAVSPAAFIDESDQGAAVGILQAIGDPLNSAGKFSDGDDHRLPASVSPSLSGAFYTSRLRCVSDRPSLTHTGQFTSLAAVVQHFNAGGDTSGFPGTSEIRPMGLSDSSVVDMAAFLTSLQGPGPDAALLVAPK